MQRRQWLHAGLAIGGVQALSLQPLWAAAASLPATTQVVVIGGGYGGATAAKYIRMFSNYAIGVMLIEPNSSFISCPMSNLVIGGSKTMSELTTSYDALTSSHGITVVKDRVIDIDILKKTVKLLHGPTLAYDKLVLSPGVDMMLDSIEGLREAHAAGHILQAWKAGAETLALRKQLEAMPDGGVYALTVPEAPLPLPARAV